MSQLLLPLLDLDAPAIASIALLGDDGGDAARLSVGPGEGELFTFDDWTVLPFPPGILAVNPGFFIDHGDFFEFTIDEAP